MTSYNHTGIAICALVATQEAPVAVKLAVCGALLLSHLPLDAIPHRHLYIFETIKESHKDKIGGLIEVGGGMILLPILISIFAHLNLFWLAAYTLSASGLDILVGLGFSSAKRLNHWIHWWENKLDVADKVTFEIFQTILVFIAVALSIGGS